MGRWRGLAHGSTIDLTVDPVCQVALILHLRGEAPKDLTQKPPDCVCNIADTGVAYVADQPIGVDRHSVHHPAVDFQVQYAGRGFVLADLYSDYSSALGIHMPDTTVASLGSACGTSETAHQVAVGVRKCSHPGMTICLVFHMMYNTTSGVTPEKTNSSSDQYGW